jgi:hypothetical protein
MRCSTCHLALHPLFTISIRNIYLATLKECPSCGISQFENPNRWLEDAYKTPITSTDTGLVARNLNLKSQSAALLYYLFGNNGAFLDVAGGTGLYVRLMRDIGFNFFYYDKYATNIHARGFEVEPHFFREISALTMFETLEHIENPSTFLADLISKFQPEAIFFTTELIPESGIDPSWWYLAPKDGQHITFYTASALSKLANSISMEFFTCNQLHFFAKPALITAIRKYYSSSWTRRRNIKEMSSKLIPKTWSDHQLILARENSA